jgi:hypothetical protein
MIACVLLILGLASLLTSAYLSHMVLAFIGLGLTFWGALLLYITPSRHVPLELMNAITYSGLANLDKLLRGSKVSILEIPPGISVNPSAIAHVRRALMSGEAKAYNIVFKLKRGVYLPPRYLKDPESSLVFVPSSGYEAMPAPEEVQEDELYLGKIWHRGLFLTPPGAALCEFLERELGTSFAKTDLDFVLNNLPRLLIEETEIADDVVVEVEGNSITVQVTNHMLWEMCRDVSKLEKVHELVGCPLSSSIACALAKASGRPVIIDGDEVQDRRTSKIRFILLEG